MGRSEAKRRIAVQKYLRENPGSNLTDAYQATGYKGPPLKIKEGNLNDGRSRIRLSERGDAGDSNRRQSMSLRPPQTPQEQNQNRRQNYKRSSLRKQGKDVVIDHVVELDLLRQTVQGLRAGQAKQTIERLEQSYGPLGNRPGNRKIIGSKTNELKRQQSKAVQKRLGQMEASNPSTIDLFRNEIRMVPVPGVGTLQGGGHRVSMDPLGTGASIMLP